MEHGPTISVNLMLNSVDLLPQSCFAKCALLWPSLKRVISPGSRAPSTHYKRTMHVKRKFSDMLFAVKMQTVRHKLALADMLT